MSFSRCARRCGLLLQTLPVSLSLFGASCVAEELTPSIVGGTAGSGGDAHGASSAGQAGAGSLNWAGAGAQSDAGGATSAGGSAHGPAEGGSAHGPAEGGAAGSHSSSPHVCGPAIADDVWTTIDFDEECERAYGAGTTAVDHAQFLYSTACEGENVNNASLDLEVACVRLLGADAFPVKVGINARDWRCATPSDAAGRFVPILIVPSDHFTPADVPFVAEAVGRLQSLADDVRAFFAEESGRSVHGTSVLVQLGGADSGYVNQLASSSLSTAEYHNQLLSDLGPAKLFATAASGRIWVMPYVSEENNPSKLGAGAQGAFAFLPPAAGQSACSSAPSASYDAAFYAFGHNAGLALGLKLTHEYGMSLPDDWQTSIMASGAGTRSQLFPFEEKALTEALDAWQ